MFNQPLDEHTDDAPADIGEAISNAVKDSLGYEYEELAERLAPALHQAVDLAVTASTKPLHAWREQLARESAEKATEALLAEFGKKHPDWSEHEARMVAFSKQIVPGEGMTQDEYLENLYHLATHGGRPTTSAPHTARVVEEAAGPSSRLPTFEEAAKAAVAGRRL